MKSPCFSKKTLAPVGLLLALSACSVFEEEPPEPLSEFVLLARPSLEADCPEPFGRVCTWSTEDTLTGLVQGLQERPGPDPNSVWTDLVFGDSTQILTLYNLPSDLVPLEIGHRYSVDLSIFQIVLSGYNSLLIEDEDGLVFYAASGFPLSSQDSIVEPDGWTFELESAGYESLNALCGVHMTPQALIVEHDGSRLRMEQGETRQLGAYTVQARIAAEIEYPEQTECTDTFIPELSVVIYRTPG